MPMTPGLMPNIRLPGPEEEPLADGDVIVEIVDDGEDKTKTDKDGAVLEIEHPDGSITISLDGKPINDNRKERDETDWFRNLVDDVSQGNLNDIAQELMRGIRDDISSRNDWIEDRAQGIKLLGLKIEIPGLQGATDGAPVEGMSKVRHPLLLEAVLRFQANARSELLPTDGPVKIRNDNNNATLENDQLANALENDLNHYLTSTATEYYPDTDRMLLMLGFGGTAFKKVYFCPLRNRPVSESVDANDLIVNNAATDLRNAKRITHRSYMRPSTVKRLQILGVYADIDLSTPKAPDLDSVQREKNAQQGISAESMSPEDRDREIYEVYCELDLPGFEHKHKGKHSGLEIPYIVTIDVSSQQVLSVVRNYPEDDQDLPTAKRRFVKYTFVPGMGFYDIGLLHILGNTTNAITAAWRELLDAGMYNNFPGFLMADTGARQNTNIFRVPPGGGALVKTNGMPINQAIMPLPYKEPSGALMNLVVQMAETGMRVGGTSEVMVTEGKPDAPVGTTLAMIEQAQKVLNSVHKRLHAAQSEEFEMLVECFKDHPESFWQKRRKAAYPWDEKTFLDALDNYYFTPQADPNTSSQTQRLMKVLALKQLVATNPTLYDPIAVDTAALQALGWSNPQQFMIPASAQGKPPPELLQAQAKMAVEQSNAQARMLDSQTRAKEAQDRLELDHMRLQMEQSRDQGDPSKMLGLQVQQQEIQQRQQDAMLDAVNRKRDRESRERLAAIKLAEEMMRNPDASPMAQSVLDPQMLQRLEGNEPTLDGTQTGEL
ncbi:hypothetical protein UFOVP231_7 [uncultured Caudovirales phage]|uniref:Uncharacterized protein n=1 Tax=uncultured Caudovirales phage TaxID=2100421 RepID=A0A6J7WPR0_9CAUD|nr:hypothetical protein UFOVP231_7 [uncultured Caudovirales phage]